MQVQFITAVESEEDRTWNCCGRDIPKAEIVFFVQVTLIYIVAITSLINISLGTEHCNLWISLLSGCLGCILPAPKIYRARHGSFLSNITKQ